MPNARLVHMYSLRSQASAVTVRLNTRDIYVEIRGRRMCSRLAWITVFTAGFMMLSFNASAQEAEVADSRIIDDGTGRFLIVYDSSNSMWGELADKSRKYEAGRTALSNFLDGNLGQRQVGFRAYGHRRKTDCRDSELVVPFSDAASAKAPIESAVTSIRPTGKTPITYSLQEGLKDFAGAPGDILLISDGIETCDADPCDLMREWRASNVSIRVHVVGVGLNDMERRAMSCIAAESGGQYFDADSAEGFEDALSEASVAIEEPAIIEAGVPNPADQGIGYSLLYNALDADGRSYRAPGKLFLNGEEIGTVESKGYGRNVIAEAGDYEILVGPLLKDGTIFKPVRQAVSITTLGRTTVDILVEAPARVTAKFIEEGETHPGSHVTAYKDGEKVFSFRAKDEALARAGDYEFRAEPNSDNKMSVNGTLVENEHTEIVFDLTKTVTFYVVYKLPDGTTFRRGSRLWRDGEELYYIYSGNPSRARPGVYELRSDDQNLPLTPVEIEITTDGETIEVPIEAGWVKITYAPSDYDYAGKPNRAWLEAVDRGGSKSARLDFLIPVTPGHYAIKAQDSKGFFDRPEFDVVNGETVEVVLTPEPLGELVMTYAPSDRYEKEPDRASAYALDGQRIIGGILRPGIVRKFLPGRYGVKGHSSAGDIEPQDVTVVAGERTEVVLKLSDE